MNAAQFIVVPLTGVQICRGHLLPHLGKDIEKIWAAAKRLGEKPKIVNPLTSLIANHITCDRDNEVESTPWLACSPTEAVFFRLRKANLEYVMDLVIDTRNGIGRQPVNSLRCFMEYGTRMLLTHKKYHLGTVVVDRNDKPANEKGSLILDFGNTATCAIFSGSGTLPQNVRPVFFHNPFDPFEFKEDSRPAKEKCVLKSTAFVLRAPETKYGTPWIVLGKRAEELIEHHPLETSLYAPKKYVRQWPQEQKAIEPSANYRGIVGQLLGLFPRLRFVEYAVSAMMELVQSTRVNPNFGFQPPSVYPQVTEVLLTYPLTWREVDKELFRAMVQKIGEEIFVLGPAERNAFRVELICSEPVAVATYVLWDVLFRLFQMAPTGANLRRPSLASSMLGNVDGTQEVRLLIVDIGGGSSDVALLEAKWELGKDETGPFVDVRTRVLESLRFNRAGDRISHLMATAILEFLREKYGITESLDFNSPANSQAFTIAVKREIVSKIMDLTEAAKRALARNQSWQLAKSDELFLTDKFRPVMPPQDVQPRQMEVTNEVLEQWIQKDYASDKTRGEPGFMDVFLYLRDLQKSLNAQTTPHLVILSGRATRLPFIKQMTARAVGLPTHRVRTLAEILPDSLKTPDHENADKLAVVHGAHRLRFGNPIRFFPQPEEPIFKRFLGTLVATQGGLELNAVLVQRGQKQPAHVTIQVPPNQVLQLGSSFRERGTRAQLMASLANNTHEMREAQIDFVDDHSLVLKKSKQSEGLTLTEYVPGGTSLIVDNFNDTGQIDCEPVGFLRGIVSSNKNRWMRLEE